VTCHAITWRASLTNFKMHTDLTKPFCCNPFRSDEVILLQPVSWVPCDTLPRKCLVFHHHIRRQCLDRVFLVLFFFFFFLSPTLSSDIFHDRAHIFFSAEFFFRNEDKLEWIFREGAGILTINGVNRARKSVQFDDCLSFRLVRQWPIYGQFP